MEARVSVVGLDIAKSVFQVHAADNFGRPVIRRKLKREEVESFFRALTPCLVGLEACPGSHFWARLLRDMGHDVRLLPAQYVKPYVKTNKNDAADAEAICEAVTRPTMRFVPIKEEMQQEVLVIHRVREMLIRQRTQLINGIRGHLAEFGIIGPNRSHKIGLLTKLIEDPDCDELPAVARHALQYLVNQLREVSAKLFKIDRDLIAVARNSNACRRLMSIPGVGVITATALVSSMREPADFKSGRHFAAWLGLVPRQHSTGGKESLGGISKRGNGYLRKLLIHGSRSIMRWRGRSWTWLAQLRDRRPANVAAVAIANKTARVVWALLRFGGTYNHPTRPVALSMA
ncbi:IS110 family transposase [Ensifer aridi]|uniref:IS110 family transposase n=1 Tax=Ensifer aridi TaxID=1708715 RepID=UPI00358E6A5B